MLRINDIFYSIQGEGFNVGMPAVFVKLSGCNIECDFCDAGHNKYTEMSEICILEVMKTYACNKVVITGGEPFTQELEPFLKMLKEHGYKIFVETNGSIGVKTTITDLIDWITLSPKTTVRLSRWDELKLITDLNTANEELKSQIQPLFERCPNALMYLQPRTTKYQETTLANYAHTIRLVKEIQPCYLSARIHKLLNLK